MAQIVTLGWSDPVVTTNARATAPIEIWRSISGGALAQLGSDIALGVETLIDNNGGVGYADAVVVDYEARVYNDNGGEVEGTDYIVTDLQVTIVDAATPVAFAKTSTLVETPASSNEWYNSTGSNWAQFFVSTSAIVGDFEYEILVEDVLLNDGSMFGISTSGVNRKYNTALIWEIIAYIDASGNIKIGNNGTASFTDPDTITNVSYSSGDKLILKRVGAVITLYYNAALVETFPNGFSTDCYLHGSALSLMYLSQPKVLN